MDNPTDLILTGIGYIQRQDLQVKKVPTPPHNGIRGMATEWYFKGELVKRDVHIDILKGVSTAGESGEF